MTREELKEHCKKTVEQCEMWAIHRGEEPSGKVYEEHKTILDILEQEPCDTISREAVLKRIAQFSTEEGSSVRVQPLYSDMYNMPPVTPSRRKGHWITRHYIQNGKSVDMTVCSVCQEEFSYDAETGI